MRPQALDSGPDYVRPALSSHQQALTGAVLQLPRTAWAACGPTPSATCAPGAPCRAAPATTLPLSAAAVSHGRCCAATTTTTASSSESRSQPSWRWPPGPGAASQSWRTAPSCARRSSASTCRRRATPCRSGCAWSMPVCNPVSCAETPCKLQARWHAAAITDGLAWLHLHPPWCSECSHKLLLRLAGGSPGDAVQGLQARWHDTGLDERAAFHGALHRVMLRGRAGHPPSLLLRPCICQTLPCLRSAGCRC